LQWHLPKLKRKRVRFRELEDKEMLRRMTVAFTGGALMMLAACAQAPQPAIDGANQALEKARAAGAEEYAPEAWQLAQDSLKSATTEVQAQNDKFALMRSYDQATQLLDKATKAADAAASEAASAREEAKKRAETAIQEAQAAVTAAQAALEKAPKGKGTEADLLAMKAELESMTASLSKAQEQFNAGKYLAVESSAHSVTEQANAIAADIAQAQSKSKKRA
jgi:hypothetical protein